MKNKAFKTDDLFIVNPLYFLKELLYKAPSILIAAIIGILVATYFANKFTTVSYKSVAKIIRYDKKISMPKDVPYKFQNFNYDTALQTIRTRENLNEAIKALNLDTTVEKIYSSYEIKRRKRSDIIEILFTNGNKELSVKGANVLAEIFLKNFYKVQNAATKEVLVYYGKQKESLIKEIEVLLSTKEKFNKENKILSIKVQKDYKYEQLNEVALNLIDTKVLKNEYETKIKQINIKLKQIPKEVQLEYSVRSADLKAIANKEKELDAMNQKYTKHNPKIKTLKKEIAKMKSQYANKKNKKSIPDEITYGNNPLFTALIIELSQSKIGVISSTNRIKELFEQQNNIENEIKELNILEKKYSVIAKKIDEKNSLLDLVTKRQNELKIALESSQEDFKFLERAKPPKYPESNFKKAMILGTGFLSALVFTGFFILKLFFDFRIKGAFDIERRFNIKLIGEFFNTKDNNIIKENTMDFITSFMKTMKNKKIVLLGSDVASTGKTHISEVLTYFCSTTKQKVLYIETVSEITPEIEGSIINCSDIENLKFDNVNVVNEYVHKLYIQDSEINDYYLANTNISEKLFENLKTNDYDLVLFEVLAFGVNTYFFKNFAPLADLVLLVFKCNSSSRKTIDPVVEEINSLGISHVKGVLNVIDNKSI